MTMKHVKPRAPTRTRQTAVVVPPRVETVQPAEQNKPAPSGGFAALLESVEQEVVAVTYWFDPVPRPQPYPVTIKFTGRRAGVEGKLQPRDQFVHYETIDRVIPGSGPISITAQIRDINPGEWSVTATAQPSAHAVRGTSKRQMQEVAAPAPAPRSPLARFWRWWAPSAGSDEGTSATIKTCMSPLARTPGTLLGSWFAFVVLGIILALVVQSVVIAHDHLAAGPLWLIRILGILGGFAGAKIWFLAKHGREGRWEGWCVQGSVAGGALVVIVLLLAFHVSIGTFADALAPGLLTGMAVGRIGCFFAGCCGGPPTAARWGIWSSDQRVGARRVPTQLMESSFTMLLALAALATVLARGPANGAIFVAGMAAFTLGRQGILRLRLEAEAIQVSVRQRIVTVVASLAFIASVVVAVLHYAGR
jgi:phosphatidylglycerol---prolipoprotein diacylglyceryl transferase